MIIIDINIIVLIIIIRINVVSLAVHSVFVFCLNESCFYWLFSWYKLRIIMKYNENHQRIVNLRDIFSESDKKRNLH